MDYDILNIAYNHIGKSSFHTGTGCYIITKKGCDILSQYVFPINEHVDALIYMLNDLGYLKMILSTSNAAKFNFTSPSTIGHGRLVCDNQAFIFKLFPFISVLILVIVIWYVYNKFNGI